MGDIFSSFFGGGQRNTGPKKAKPKLVEVEVSLNDVYIGTMKNVEIERYRNCEECDGKGGKNV
jgi:DnaJ family protein A protein 2